MPSRPDLSSVSRDPVTGQMARALDRCAVGRGSPLVLGVSGGVDSTAMLLIATVLKRRGELGQVTCAHVHHHLRAEADAESEAVRELAESLEAEFIQLHVRVDARGNIAAQARQLRYAALAGEARRRGNAAVAVAHQAEDQFETMLMAFCRGAGPLGMQGMRMRRDLEPGVELVRPLLENSRHELARVCTGAGVSWSSDPTNRCVDTARGALRERVIPQLLAIWPGAIEAALTSAEVFQCAAAALDGEIEARLGGSGETWDRALLRRAGSGWAALAIKRRLGADVEAGLCRTIGLACCDSEARPRRWSLSDGRCAVVDSKCLSIQPGPRQAS